MVAAGSVERPPHRLQPLDSNTDPGASKQKQGTKDKSGQEKDDLRNLGRTTPPSLPSDDVSSDEGEVQNEWGRFANLKCSILQLFQGGAAVDGSRTLPKASPEKREAPRASEEPEEPETKPSTASKERPFTGGGKSHTRNLWRTPGHHDDGAWTGEVKSALNAEKEAHEKKRVGGEFVVGTARAPLSDPFDPHASMLSSSIMSASSTRSTRSQPAHNPYSSMGVGPSGRWILKDGRPCCVPLDALTGPAQTSRVLRTRDSITSSKDHRKGAGGRRLTPHNHSVLGLEPPAGTQMGRRKTFFSLADFGFASQNSQSSSSSSSRSSGSSSSGSYSSRSYSSSSSSSGQEMTTLARSCRTTTHGELKESRESRASRKHSQRHARHSTRQHGSQHVSHHGKHDRHHRASLVDKRQTQRRRSHKSGEGVFDEIEEIQDILKPLDHAPSSGDELSHVLPRFSWTPGLSNVLNSTNPTATATEDFVHHDLPFLSSRSSHKIDMMVSHNLKYRRKGGHARRQTRRSSHRRTVGSESGHTIKAVSRRDTLLSAGSRRTTTRCSKGFNLLHGNPTRRTSHVPGHTQDGRAGKMVDRDLRSELKKLQQSLLTSAQQAFGNDVWEECGIEAEHLKRQQLAQLIHGGLSLNLSDKRKEDVDVEEEEEREEDTEEPAEVTKRHSVKKKEGKPGQRVTVVLGVNFKGSEETSQPSRASSKGAAVGKPHKKKTLKDKH